MCTFVHCVFLLSLPSLPPPPPLFSVRLHPDLSSLPLFTITTVTILLHYNFCHTTTNITTTATTATTTTTTTTTVIIISIIMEVTMITVILYN